MALCLLLFFYTSFCLLKTGQVVVQMREPKISFVSELKAQIINDLCRLQHYTMILTNYKSQLAYMPNGFIYGGAEACKA